MGDKYTLHFISHTHWDREWYFGFERHRIRLVELMDKLIETAETDEDFKSFHLDGQSIVIEDYLAVKPHMKYRLIGCIKNGKIIIGPWYVLQDEYLISAESNVRNMLYGLQITKKYGNPSMTGYFPDSFGNISQAPQILNGFNITNAAFGRGITTAGADNTVGENINKFCSEVVWRSPDGSEVIGAVFLNWYNNASEIPSDAEDAKKHVDIIGKNAARFATTPHLLMMNGCDHQPVQSDIGRILKKIQPDYPDMLVHSNFDDYFKAILPYKKNFGIWEGELDSDFSDGWWTLANTASARLYLKQYNHRAQNLIEKQAEPLSAAAFWCLPPEKAVPYRSEYLFFAWKTLMENHPHDSICGCSTDDVHAEMVTRYKKAIQIGEEVTARAAKEFTSQINTKNSGEINIVVFNPTADEMYEITETYIDFPKEEVVEAENLSLLDADGVYIPCSFDDLGVVFNFVLPEDKFRQVIYVRRFKIRFSAEVPAMGYKTFIVKKEKNTTSSIKAGENFIENGLVRISVNKNGTLDITDKKTGLKYKNQQYFEDTGDAGDEYVYRQTIDNSAILSLGNHADIKLECIKASYATISAKIKLMIPSSCNTANKIRSDDLVPLEIKTYFTLSENLPRVDIKTEIDNKSENHRIRAMFQSDINTDYCMAGGHYDVIKRRIKPWEGWKNPSYPKRMVDFVSVFDDQKGLLIATRGLPEYEILRDGSNTIALTLHRGVHHIGDWGVFPTPDAQCKNLLTTEYSIIPFGGEKAKIAAEKLARGFALDKLLALQTGSHDGLLPVSDSLIKINAENIVVTATKKCETNDSIIIRYFNAGEKDENVEIDLCGKFKSAYIDNLNEDRQSELAMSDGKIIVPTSRKKIITLELL